MESIFLGGNCPTVEIGWRCQLTDVWNFQRWQLSDGDNWLLMAIFSGGNRWQAKTVDWWVLLTLCKNFCGFFILLKKFCNSWMKNFRCDETKYLNYNLKLYISGQKIFHSCDLYIVLFALYLFRSKLFYDMFSILQCESNRGQFFHKFSIFFKFSSK